MSECDSDAEEKETADAGTVVSSEAGEVRESDLCYRLTVVDRELQGKTMPLFVVILALLSIAAAFLIDFRKAQVPRSKGANHSLQVFRIGRSLVTFHFAFLQARYANQRELP